jgi:hypothetical protein
MRLAAALWALGTTAATIMLAAPARADVDTDFANQLHTYGIYGQRDYNAWLAKITTVGKDIQSFPLGIGMRDDAHVQPGNALEVVWIAGVQRKPLGDCRCGNQGIVSPSCLLAPSGS